MTTLAAHNHVVTKPDIDTRPSVVELLIEAMQKAKAVGKTGRNDQQNYNFRSAEDVVNEAHSVFKKLGILIVPLEVEAEHRDVKTSTGKASREATLKVTYRFLGPRDDFLDVRVAAEAMDFGDKATGKAWTVALRTILSQVLLLPTKDVDPDSQSYERGRDVSAQDRKSEREGAEPDKGSLVQQVLAVSEDVRQLRQESEYTAADNVVKYCQKTLGVNVVKKQNEDGAVEEIDLTRLQPGQLRLLLNVMTKALRDLKSAGQPV